MANSHSGSDNSAAFQNDNTDADEAFSNPQLPIPTTLPTVVVGLGDFVHHSSDSQNMQISIPDTVSATPNFPAPAVSDSHSSNRYPLNPGNEDLTKKKCVGRGNRALTVGECLHQGIRSCMEDFVAIVQGFMELSCEEFGGCTAPFCEYASKKSPIHLFGVFDGHGGDQVSKLCANLLPDMVKEEWLRCSEEDGWKKRWEVALCRAYQRMDDIFKDRSIAPYSVGSTALVVILSACRIVAANCGDSRAVLARGTRPICLTVDHRLTREDERVRIASGGGKILDWDGPRVEGILSLTRAIGDHGLKPWIISIPEVTILSRNEQDEFLVLASDGLWDVLSTEKVAAVARRELRKHRRKLIVTTDLVSPSSIPASLVAKNIVKGALDAYNLDNISVIVVDLKRLRRKQPQGT